MGGDFLVDPFGLDGIGIDTAAVPVVTAEAGSGEGSDGSVSMAFCFR